MTLQPKQFSYEYASIFQDASVVAAYPQPVPYPSDGRDKVLSSWSPKQRWFDESVRAPTWTPLAFKYAPSMSGAVVKSLAHGKTL
jgi:hypothetical protein